jgi:DNA processing protein
MAREIAASAAARGWTVISGAAYGAGGSAHSAALGAGGTTVAVLACGVDMAYPSGHKDLLDAVAENGVIASEWSPGRNPSPRPQPGDRGAVGGDAGRGGRGAQRRGAPVGR